MEVAEMTPFTITPVKLTTSPTATTWVLAVQSPQTRIWPELSLAPEAIKVETATVPEISG